MSYNDAQAREHNTEASVKAAVFMEKVSPLIPKVTQISSPSTSVTPEWAKSLIERRLLMEFSGDSGLYKCPHLSTDAPIFMVSWVDYMVCRDCLTHIPLATAEEDMKCDRCGANPVPTYVWISQSGPYVVMGGICEACRKDEVSHAKVDDKRGTLPTHSSWMKRWRFTLRQDRGRTGAV